MLVHCPDLTKPSFTPATPYNYPFTVGATSKTQFITGSSYVSTTSTSSQCPLTFTLFDVTSSSAYSGSFLEVDAQGNVKVDTNQKLSKTIKAQWQYYDKTPDPTKLTTGTTPQFVISTSCPTLVLTAISPATYSFDLPTSPASSATVLKTGASYVNIAVAKCAKTY